MLLAESQRKTVEHLEGGILKRLLVKPGDHVATGQIVAQLDATQTEEQLAQIEANRLGLAFDIWRLEAEEAGTALDPAAARRRRPTPSAAKLIAAQRALFDARQRAHVGQVAALRRQIDQLRAQRTANLAQATAADRQLASWTEERALNATLVDKGATPRQKLFEIDRTIALARRRARREPGPGAAALEEIARAEADIETARPAAARGGRRAAVRGAPPARARWRRRPAARRTCSSAATSARRRPAPSSTSAP